MLRMLRSLAAQRRCFSACAVRHDSYGFIGLGQMVSFKSFSAKKRHILTWKGLSNGEEPSSETSKHRHCTNLRYQQVVA